MVGGIEYLPSKWEALSNSSTIKREKKPKKPQN
jgi:hypothetical protein